MRALQLGPSHGIGRLYVPQERESVISVVEIPREYRRSDTVVHALRPERHVISTNRSLAARPTSADEQVAA